MGRRTRGHRSTATSVLRTPNSGPPSRQDHSHDKPLTREEASVAVVDWIDERTSLSGGTRWLLFRNVPKGTGWAHTLGSATLVAFLSQAVTGVFLALCYRPDASGGAYESVRSITDDVFLGQFVRACTSGAPR